MSRIAQTTTLVVTPPTAYASLEARFKLLRYELPPKLRWSKNPADYGRMQNSLRDQIAFPYKTFKYDRLDGAPKWVVYVLAPRESQPQSLTLAFLSDAPLPWREIAFAQLDLHLLLKLLQIAYFRGEQAGRFVGQDHCYVYAKQVKEHRYHICLQIDLKGDLRNQPGDARQEFKVTGSARPFKRVDEPRQVGRAYFARKVRGDKAYFVHLRAAEVVSAVQAKEPVYEIRTREGQRTTLSYHNQEHLDESVGKLLADFLGAFIAYLADYGIASQLKERTFERFDPPKNQAQLPLEYLNPIAVYDNRLQKEVPLQTYLAAFESALPTLRFVAITDLAEGATGGVLVVQDCDKEDFEEEGVLHEWTDPYIALYQRAPQIPKQSINVNPNDREHATAAEYLRYSLSQEQREVLVRKLEMALYQLYLKEVILHERSVEERLPLAPKQYVFIRKARASSETHETMLFFSRDRLRFVDLRDEAGRIQRDELLRELGVNWDDMYDRMLEKYHRKSGDQEARDLPSYDVMIGPDCFIELENLNERVLYNYAEIARRQAALYAERPVEDFKLLFRYDLVRQAATLSFEEMQQRGLLHGEVHPRTKQEQDSLVLYQRLERYDALLEEVSRTHATISFHDLTRGELMERIARIFDLQPDARGHYHRGTFKWLYQRLGFFLSDKGGELHLYQGIWYDGEHCYMVGAPLPLKQNQPRAHLIRCFDVYMGADHFDMQPLLAATSVTFVRLNQYTVSPYPFHLIDLFVETVLRYQQA